MTRTKAGLVAWVLATKVKVASLDQLARTFWDSPTWGRREAEREVCALERRGLVQRIRVLLHPEIPLSGPLIEWQPGDQTPDFVAIAYQLLKRWTEPLRITTIIAATAKANRYYGSAFTGVVKRPVQLTHDYHVSAIFFRLLNSDPRTAEAWMPEEAIAKERRGAKLPDAILRGLPGGDIVIEFGGSYRRERIERVHEDCKKRELRYQLW